MQFLRSYHLHIDDTYQATTDNDAYYDLDAHEKHCFGTVAADVSSTVANSRLRFDAEEEVTRKTIYPLRRRKRIKQFFLLVERNMDNMQCLPLLNKKHN